MLKEIHILTIFYGKEHAKYLGETMLPSLVRSLDGIHRKVKTRQYIYCLPEDEMDVYRAEWEVNVDTGLLNVKNPRLELHKAIIRQIEISSRVGATIVFVQADHVYGFGLRGLLEKHNDKFVVCSHGRIRASAFEDVKMFLGGSFTNKDFSIQNYTYWQHYMVTHGLNNPEKYWKANRNGDVIDVYFKEPAPVLFPADTKIIEIIQNKEYKGHTRDSAWGAFEAIDHEVVDYYYRTNGLYYCKDSNEFIWTEFTDDKEYVPTVPQVEGINACWIDSAKFFRGIPYRVFL